MSNINFTCPHCSFSKQLPASVEVQQGNCPSCGIAVTIRDNATAVPNPPAKNKMFVWGAVGCGAMVVLGLILIPATIFVRLLTNASQVEGQPVDPDVVDLTVMELPSITNTIGMTLNEIPAGTFLMGTQEAYWETFATLLPNMIDAKREQRQHKVTITKAFYMQTTEVTQGQWKAVMGTEPWKENYENRVKEGPNYPAVLVSWVDAVAFCKKLSVREGKTYRLPTEAEWEYACRAGTETVWSFGNDRKALGDYAWCRENAWSIGEKYSHQVGIKKPNQFGLYDMYGNLSEYCHDYWDPYYYTKRAREDPTGPEETFSVRYDGVGHVKRGGTFNGTAYYARSASRVDSGRPRLSGILAFTGFRVVRELD